MICVGDDLVEPGIPVVSWLRDAVDKPPPNPAQVSPAEDLRPALRAAGADDRNESLLALFDALEESDDAFRTHLLYSLHGFSTGPLIERYVDLLPPQPARWLIAARPDAAYSVAALAFHTILSGPGHSEQLKPGMLALAERVLTDQQLLSYCVSFRTSGEGLTLARRHLDALEPVDETLAWSLGMNVAADAPSELTALAAKLRPYPGEVRARFLVGAAVRISPTDQDALAEALDLNRPRPMTSDDEGRR